MEGLKQYLTAITAAAIICAIAKMCAEGKTSSGAVIKLIAGLIMAFTVIAPVIDMNLGDLPVLSSQISIEAEAAGALGEEMAMRETNSIITERLEAYILDKAVSVGAEVEVEIELEESYPVAVIVKGSILPEAKFQLQQILEADLGIAKENQKWIQ